MKGVRAKVQDKEKAKKTTSSLATAAKENVIGSTMQENATLARRMQLLAASVGNVDSGSQASSSRFENSLASNERTSISEERPEVRGAPFRREPTQLELKKLNRALNERITLINRERGDDASSLRETFKVRGSTGSVYEFIIDKKPRCDCPDFDGYSDDTCKHVIFVFLEALDLPQRSHLWYQEALLQAELKDIFDNEEPDPNLINTQFQEAYLKVKSQQSASAARKKARSGSSCPLCYYDSVLLNRSKEFKFGQLSCVNSLHKASLEAFKAGCQETTADCRVCLKPFIEEEEDENVAYAGGKSYVNIPIDSVDDYCLEDTGKDLGHYSKTALKKMYDRGQCTYDVLSYWSGGRY